MAQFTTRVELHGVILEAYGRLHSAMEHQGFSRIIKAEDGTGYVLPTGEYNRAGDDLTTARVLSDAKIAAASVAAKFSILVTESSPRVWIASRRPRFERAGEAVLIFLGISSTSGTSASPGRSFTEKMQSELTEQLATNPYISPQNTLDLQRG